MLFRSIAEQDGTSPEAALADWQDEHAGLHGYDAMRRALDSRFAERMLERRPFLHRSLERPELEPLERAAIARGEISAIGFRWVGVSS